MPAVDPTAALVTFFLMAVFFVAALLGWMRVHELEGGRERRVRIIEMLETQAIQDSEELTKWQTKVFALSDKIMRGKEG